MLFPAALPTLPHAFLYDGEATVIGQELGLSSQIDVEACITHAFGLISQPFKGKAGDEELSKVQKAEKMLAYFLLGTSFKGQMIAQGLQRLPVECTARVLCYLGEAAPAQQDLMKRLSAPFKASLAEYAKAKSAFDGMRRVFFAEDGLQVALALAFQGKMATLKKYAPFITMDGGGLEEEKELINAIISSTIDEERLPFCLAPECTPQTPLFMLAALQADKDYIQDAVFLPNSQAFETLAKNLFEQDQARTVAFVINLERHALAGEIDCRPEQGFRVLLNDSIMGEGDGDPLSTLRVRIIQSLLESIAGPESYRIYTPEQRQQKASAGCLIFSIEAVRISLRERARGGFGGGGVLDYCERQVQGKGIHRVGLPLPFLLGGQYSSDEAPLNKEQLSAIEAPITGKQEPFLPLFKAQWKECQGKRHNVRNWRKTCGLLTRTLRFYERFKGEELAETLAKHTVTGLFSSKPNTAPNPGSQ